MLGVAKSSEESLMERQDKRRVPTEGRRDFKSIPQAILAQS